MRRMRKKDLNILFWCLMIYFIVYILSKLTLLQWFFLIFSVIGFIIIRKIHLKNIRLKEVEERRLELEKQGKLDKLMELDGFEFENYICNLFKELGFDAELTRSTGDGGKDLFIYKENFFAIAECKRFGQKNKVGRPMVQKLHSAILDCNANKGFLITTSEFTKPAKDYVLDKPITLIDGNSLIEIIREVTEENKAHNLMEKLITSDQINN